MYSSRHGKEKLDGQIHQGLCLYIGQDTLLLVNVTNVISDSETV